MTNKENVSITNEFNEAMKRVASIQGRTIEIKKDSRGNNLYFHDDTTTENIPQKIQIAMDLAQELKVKYSVYVYKERQGMNLHFPDMPEPLRNLNIFRWSEYENRWYWDSRSEVF